MSIPGILSASSINPDAGEGFSYSWTFNDNPLSFTDSYIENLSPGYYQLFVQDNLTGCQEVFGPFFIKDHPFFYTVFDI